MAKFNNPTKVITGVNTRWDEEVLDKKHTINLGDALLEMIPPQIYKVGTTVSYSNGGVALAVYIVECVSRMDYTEYVQQNICEPLGMYQTSIFPECSDNEWVGNISVVVYVFIARNVTLW